MQIRPLALLTALAPLASAPALAGTTPWQEIAPGTNARLVAADRLEPDGSTMLGLEIALPAGTKTYWRVPGETGLPPRLELTAPGAGSHDVLWPMPERDTAGGFEDYAYFDHVVIPLVLHDARPAASVRLDMLVGICSEICVPASASFSLPLDFGRADAASSLRIRQAVAEVPLPWPDESPFGDVRWDSVNQHLLIPLGNSAVLPQTLIADAGDPAILFGAPQKSPVAGTLVLPLLGPKSQHLSMDRVRLTFMTPEGAYETVHPLAGSTPSGK